MYRIVIIVIMIVLSFTVPQSHSHVVVVVAAAVWLSLCGENEEGRTGGRVQQYIFSLIP